MQESALAVRARSPWLLPLKHSVLRLVLNPSLSFSLTLLISFANLF